MARNDSTVLLSRAFVLWCSVVAIAALYFAKEVLLPLALAILLSFLLAPLVKRLEKWGARRIPAVLIVVGIAFGAMTAFGYLLASQVYDLAYRLPDYKENIVAKLQSLEGGENSVLESATKAIDDVRRKLMHKAPAADTAHAKTGTTTGGSLKDDNPAAAVDKDVVQPVPVEIVNETSAQAIAQSVLGPLIGPVGTAAMIVVFVVFMLIERENLRNRVIHLIGSRQLNFATQALDDAASRVSRFLLMQLLVNAAFGIVVAIGLFFIGLPNALVWGALATALRFVPYIGPWIAATIPVLLAAAVFEGWTRPILVLALFIGNELVSNNVIEPWLYGSSTGISTMGILVSAVFWAWLWGPVGLVMATPLTVCLTVMGRYVPQLSFLNTLLSDDEVLSPDARFYQRLLALDPEEATDIAEEYLAANSLEALYDNVLLPALRLAEEDRHHGDLDETKERFILTAVRELVDELGAKAVRAADAQVTEEDSGASRAAQPNDAPIVCLPARDEADEIVELMLGQLLVAKGVRVVLVSVQALSGEMLTRVAEEAPGVVCVSALPPLAETHARYLCKRLRRQFPQLKIVVGLWQTTGSTKKAQARLVETGIDHFVTSLAEACEHLTRIVASQRLLAGASHAAD